VAGASRSPQGGDSGNRAFASDREGGLTLVNRMGANIHRYDQVLIQVEDRAEIALDVHRLNRATVLRREPMDFMRTQSGVEGIRLENCPRPARGLLLSRGQGVEFFPKTIDSRERVLHSVRRGGGLAPLNTVSISTKRPASASAIPRLKDSGTHESSSSTKNLATSARSFGGRALICSMISAALMPEYTLEMTMTTSGRIVRSCLI